MARATALEQDGQLLAAARERIFIAPLLNEQAAQNNHEAIWNLVSSLPAEQLQTAGDSDLTGWLALVRAAKTGTSLNQQQAAIEAWRASHPNHPAPCSCRRH